MYSNERGSRFSILDILFKIIFAALFIFILVWLFQKKVPNMTPFYSNVFRENIKYMQEAGESYFTDDKMPKIVGETTRISLADMFDKKLILPFVDKDGNSCNQYDSYVSITKTDLGYELKTNLVCNGESDYTVKILGCHNYCKDNNCSKTCSIQKMTEYQYKKAVTKTVTTYTCPSGYKKSGSKCVKTTLKDSKSAVVTKTTTKTDIKDAKLIVTEGKKIELDPVVTSKKHYVDVIKTTTSGTTTYKCPSTATNSSGSGSTLKCWYYKTVSGSEIVYDTVVKTTTSGTTTTVYDDVIKNTTSGTTTQIFDNVVTSTTPKNCTSTINKQLYCNNCYVSGSSYSCTNCTSSVGSTGKTITTCSACYKSVSVETCTGGNTTYKCPSISTNSSGSGSSLKCWHYNTTSGTTTYKCPSISTNSSGSGSSLKCWHYNTTSGTTTYKCPSTSTNSSGSGSSLKCWHYKTVSDSQIVYVDVIKSTTPGTTTYKCPSTATNYSGSGSSLKCWYNENVYNCPADATNYEGSGKNLKCYRITSGSYHYECKDKTYTLKGDKCYKTIKGSYTELSCEEYKGYKLEGKKCNLYSTKTIKATAKKSKQTTYTYKWSKKESLSGWTKTGKTRVVNGKEICE